MSKLQSSASWSISVTPLRFKTCPAMSEYPVQTTAFISGTGPSHQPSMLPCRSSDRITGSFSHFKSQRPNQITGYPYLERLSKLVIAQRRWRRSSPEWWTCQYWSTLKARIRNTTHSLSDNSPWCPWERKVWRRPTRLAATKLFIRRRLRRSTLNTGLRHPCFKQ